MPTLTLLLLILILLQLTLGHPSLFIYFSPSQLRSQPLSVRRDLLENGKVSLTPTSGSLAPPTHKRSAKPFVPPWTAPAPSPASRAPAETPGSRAWARHRPVAHAASPSPSTTPGKLRESKSYCENALRIYAKPVPGTTAEEIASEMTEISAIYESFNEPEEALKLLQKSLKLLEDKLGP